MKSEFEKWYRDKYQVTKQLYFFEDTQRYEDGFAQDAWEVWQHQQSKIDELQKKNAWLSDVAERENKRANKLQEEKVSTTTLLGKTIQEKNELQKRVDAAFRVLSQFNALDDEAWKRWKREACMFSQGESNAYEHAVRLLWQALKGGEA